MRRKSHWFWLMLAMWVIMLTGCGSRESGALDSGGQSAGDGQLTKGQWIGLLGHKFGYDMFEGKEAYFSDVGPDRDCYGAVQACREWGVLVEEYEFFPDEQVNWEYAIKTSVRAIGLEKLNQSEPGMEVTEENLVEFFRTYIASVEEGALDSGVSGEDALVILGYAYDFGTDLTLPERCEVTYMEGVKKAEAGTIRPDEDSFQAVVADGSSYKEGDIIYIAPSTDAPAAALKVSSVEGDTIFYEQAAMEEVFQEIQVSGTFGADAIFVEAEEDVRVSLENGPKGEVLYANWQAGADGGAVPVGAKVSNGSVTFDKTFKNGASISVKISDIKVTADIDYGFFKGLKKADATLSFQDQVKASYKNSRHTSEQYPLGKINVPLGTTPVAVEFTLIVNLGFDGEVTLTCSSNLVAKANYREGCGFAGSVENQNAACDLHAKATITVEPAVKAEICCLSRGIVNAKVTSGVVAVGTADIDILGEEPACLDLLMWVPLRWAINEDGCVLTDFVKGTKISRVVWDSESSRIKKHFHYEDLVLVEACTRGSEKKVETVVEEEEGRPYEYKVFDFQELVFGFIRVSTQAVHLAGGESKTVQLIALPGGYGAVDLNYRTEDSSVCSVSGGTIQANGPGSTRVVISTGDGKFTTYVSVFVEQEYHDTSGFEPL